MSGAPTPVSGTPSPPAAGSEARATLSRELGEFLIELSIGVHRYAMYPSTHPSLEHVVENVVGRLNELLRNRPELSIGVAREQLVIEGVATDEKHPVLRDLARRLHGHQLGALSFSRGAQARAIEGLLAALARPSDREGEPLGLVPTDRLPRWESVEIHPVGYERLHIKGAGGGEDRGDRANRLWLALAQSALARDETPTEDADGGSVARAIAAYGRDAAYDQVIVGYLLQLAQELKDGGGEEVEQVRRRLSELLRELDPDTLRRFIEMGGNYAQRKRFLLDANQTLAADAVVKVLEAAAETSQQNISTSLTRLLSKLAVHAERGSDRLRNQASAAIRDNVTELIDNWELQDPNPEAYTLVLDAMARAAPVLNPQATEDRELPGASRLVRMALEVDAFGATVQKAVADLLDAGETAQLLELADGAGPDNRTAERIRRYVTSPSQVRRLLSGDDVEESTLATIVERMGDEAVDPLLDVLAESSSRAVRRKVFDQLVGMGPVVGNKAVLRLTDPRWFVVRNMLALLQRVETLPEGFDPATLMAHGDPRVRRAAFPLLVRSPRQRERALANAFTDSDERLVQMALLEVQGGLPETLVPTLVNRVVKGDRPAEIRALAARALGGSRSSLALDALVGMAAAGKSLFGRTRLAARSPEVLAALSTLAEVWPENPRAAEVLQTAARSRDPEVRAAATRSVP